MFWREKPRKVMLINYESHMKIVKAEKTQSGWIANWYGNEGTNSLLLPNGETAGFSLVKKWLPHSGWIGNEFGLQKSVLSLEDSTTTR